MKWGAGKYNPAFHMLHGPSGRSILHVTSDGYGWVRLNELKKVPQFNRDDIRQVLSRFKSVPGIELTIEGKGHMPHFPPEG